MKKKFLNKIEFKKRVMKNILLIFLILALFILAGCQSKTQQETISTTLPQVNVVNTGNDDTNYQLTGKTVEIDMTAKKFEFDPSTITVNKGDKVKIKLTSTDVNHGIAIPEYGISQKVDVGKTETIEFIADKSGEFTFFCNVFCGSGHKEMKGNLIVK